MTREVSLAPWAADPLADHADLPCDQTLIELVRWRLDRQERPWAIEEQQFWVVVSPPDRPRRPQGWKLHISATIQSAATVLDRVVPIVLEHECHFKFARSLRQLQQLNSPACPVGSSGKFVTLYPDNDGAAVALAQACHDATNGLPGPRVLSDRPYTPGSLVHYRYGSFDRRRTAFSPWEMIQLVIEGPNGELVPDVRLGRYTPQAWVTDPFNAVGPVDRREAQPVDAILKEYEVQRAITRSNRGAVYRARSLGSGTAVVIKEARGHVGGDRWGRDVRDQLRNEYSILGALSGAAIAPDPIQFFEFGDHAFLVMDDLAAPSLRSWLTRRYSDQGRAPKEAELRSLAIDLAELMRCCYATGVVVRDFTPGNILRDEAGQMKLVDLELAYMPDISLPPPFTGGTLAYMSPRQRYGFTPEPADDVFSLGGVLYFLATATDPFFLPDGPSGRSPRRKITDVLDVHQAPSWLAELIVQCRSENADERPGTDEIISILKREPAGPTRLTELHTHRANTSNALLAEAVAGAAEYLRTSFCDQNERVWPVTTTGRATDSLCIAHGASGIGLVLSSVCRTMPSERASQRLDQIAAKVALESAAVNDRPPGLYYGVAGIAWFLADAGGTLEKGHYVEHAVSLVEQLPPVVVRPDISSGTAGLCLAALRLYMQSGEPRMRDRAEVAATHLMETVCETPFGPGWVIPGTYRPDSVDNSYPGYAYGAAGIAYVLLCAARVTGKAEFAHAAKGVLAGLLASRLEKDGQRAWRTSAQGAGVSPFWHKGVAGIGAALVRAYSLTDDLAYRVAALDCANLIRPVLAGAPLSLFHGLTGIGEFLLDLARLLDDRDALNDAQLIADILYAQRVDRRGDNYGLFFPDEDGFAGADYATGVSGVASYLLRIVHGTPRLLMLDDLLERGNPWASRGNEPTAWFRSPRRAGLFPGDSPIGWAKGNQ